MQHQFDWAWKQFQRQPPAVRTLLLLTPFVAAAVVVLGAVFSGDSRSSPAAGAQQAVSPVPAATTLATNQAIVIATAPAGATAVTPTGAGTVAPTSAPGVAATIGVAPPQSIPLIVQTPEPLPEGTPAPEPTPALAQSNVYRIVNTGGTGANLRREPGANATRLKTVREGSEVEALGPTRDTEGVTWRSVRDGEGAVGWIATEFLQNIGSDPRATPTPAPLTLQIVDLTEAPARGAEASITVRTRPGTRCELRVFLYGPAVLPREGLGVTTSNDEGVCAWTWTVPEETVPGTWRYLVLVGTGDRQISRELNFAVR